MDALYWILIGIIFYTYVGYAVLLYIIYSIHLVFKTNDSSSQNHYVPEVCMVIAAYNEAAIIKTKMQNCRELNYPQDKLRIIFITDGSTDGTEQLVAADARFEVWHTSDRNGKTAAINRAMDLVREEVVVFCDANTMLNPDSITLLAAHFADAQIGAVAGEKRIIAADADGASASGEGIYWKYESWMKRLDSATGSVVGAAGELYAIRRSLFQPVPSDTLLDDFIISLRVVEQGYRLVYEPQAYATEAASADINEELKRKIRICAGGIQSVIRLAHLMNPFRFGWFAFQFFSHKALRWTLSPLALLLIIPVNMWLAYTQGGVYTTLLLLQALFYILILGGYFLRNTPVKMKFLFVPYYFFIMNFSVYMGFIRYIRGGQSVMWEKARRMS